MSCSNGGFLMKKTKALVFAAAFALAACVVTTPVEARQGGDFGLGFQIGDPSAAISGKLWLGDVNAINMAIGWSHWNDWVRVQADYVWHNYSLIPVSSGSLPIYYGMGGVVGVANDPWIGAHGVVGISYLFPSAPLDVFLDISPGAIIFPEPHSDIGVGLGMRFYF